MSLTKEMSSCVWTKAETLEYLKAFLYKSQWDQIDNRVLMECNDPEEIGLTVHPVIWLLQRLMDNSNGALDIYGPAEHFYTDLFKFMFPNLKDEFNYKDSMLGDYMTKHAIFKNIVQQSLALMIRPIDHTLYALLIDTFAGRVDRQLGSAYDIIVSTAFLHVQQRLVRYIREKTGVLTYQSRRYVTKSSAEVLEDYLSFWKFDDNPYDERIKARLVEYLMRSNYTGKTTKIHEVFLQTRELYNLFEFILTEHNYVFNTFEAAERSIEASATSHKFDVFIRLIHDRNEKYLFCKDVVNAVTKELKKMNKEVPGGFLKIEDAGDIEEGRYFVISYSEYLKLMDKLKLERNAITLVNFEVKRTRHLTVPIESPYGKECKPLADVLYEIMSILTVELQVWCRLRGDKYQKFEEIFLSAMAALVKIGKPKHMVSPNFVDRIGNQLREKVGKLLEDSGTPFRKHLQEHFKEPKLLSWYLLYEEVMEHWKLGYFNFMRRAINIVFAKTLDFSGRKFVSRLELTMLVQECISLCILPKVPGMLHCLGLCNAIREAPCSFCIKPIRTITFPDTLATVRKESEFQIKFDYFGNDDMYHASLLDKSTRKKLVTSDMARSFIFQLILKEVPNDHLRNTVKQTYAEELKNKWRKNKVEFYMTAEEMLTLSAEFQTNYRTACLRDARRAARHSEVFEPYIYGVEDWMKTLDRRLESFTSFAEVFPDRVFHLKCTQEGHVDSGDFLEVVKILMNENASGMCKEYWDALETLKINWFTDRDWVKMPIVIAQTVLRLLHVNPKRLQFVPDIKSFFWNLVKDGLRSSVVQEECRLPETPEVAEQVVPATEEASEPSEQPAEGSGEAVTLSKEQQLIQQLVQNYLDNNPQFIAEIVENSPQVMELRNESEEIHNKIQNAVQEALKKAEEATEKLKDTKEAMRQAAVKSEEEKKGLTEELKSRVAEIEKLKTELASRPTSFKNDPVVVKQLEAKDQKIRALEHQLLHKDNHLKRVENSHSIQNEAIRSDLAKYIEEKEILEQQLAEAAAKIAELGEQMTVINHQKVELARSTEYFKQQFEQEMMRNNSMQQELQQLQIRQLAMQQAAAQAYFHPPSPPNPYAPSTSGSIPVDPRGTSSTPMQQSMLNVPDSVRMMSINGQMMYNSSRTSSPTRVTLPPTPHPNDPNPSASTLPRAREQLMPLVSTTSSRDLPCTPPPPPALATPPPTPQRNDPPPSECGICFEKMHKRAPKTNCNVCKAQWHTKCINKWTAANPTCPMCRTNFPNPEQFPPLGSA